jgi:hypothetical protein
MSHFRERVIVTPSSRNIPHQLPSGRRSSNTPGLSQLGQNATSLTTLIVSITAINTTADMGPIALTQSTPPGATSP